MTLFKLDSGLLGAIFKTRRPFQDHITIHIDILVDIHIDIHAELHK